MQVINLLFTKNYIQLHSKFWFHRKKLKNWNEKYLFGNGNGENEKDGEEVEKNDWFPYYLTDFLFISSSFLDLVLLNLY